MRLLVVGRRATSACTLRKNVIASCVRSSEASAGEQIFSISAGGICSTLLPNGTLYVTSAPKCLPTWWRISAASNASPATETPPIASTSRRRRSARSCMRSTVKSEVPPPKSPTRTSLRARQAWLRNSRAAAIGSGQEADLGEAGDARRALEAVLRVRVVGVVDREARRPPEHHARDVGAEVAIGARAHLAQERADQVLEVHRPLVDVRADEAAARQVLLDRADQPALHARAPRTRASASRAVEAARRVGKVQHAAQDARVARRRVERDRRMHAARVRRREQRVGGAEVDRVDEWFECWAHTATMRRSGPHLLAVGFMQGYQSLFG